MRETNERVGVEALTVTEPSPPPTSTFPSGSDEIEPHPPEHTL